MSDLIVGIAILAAISALVAVAAVRLAERCNRPVFLWLAGVVFVLAIGLYLLLLYDHAWLARLLPFSNVIVLGNIVPVLSSGLAGLLWGVRHIPLVRRALLCLGLLIPGWYTAACHFWNPPVPSGQHWSPDGVCVQSSPATAGACAAATLLDYYGIVTDEAEMVRACLCSPHDTPLLGIYRALKQKTADSPYRVRVELGNKALADETALPLLLSVDPPWPTGCSPLATPERRLRCPHTRHLVVLYGYDENGDAVIGDPAVGKSVWSAEHLAARYRGEALGLERR